MIDQNPIFNIDYSKSQLVIMHEILTDVMHTENKAEEQEKSERGTVENGKTK